MPRPSCKLEAGNHRHNRGQVLIFVMGAFAEMPGNVIRICNITAGDLAQTHVSYYVLQRRCQAHQGHTQAAQARGTRRTAAGARLLLDRARNLALPTAAWRTAAPTPTAQQYGRTRTARTATSSLTTLTEREGYFAA